MAGSLKSLKNIGSYRFVDQLLANFCFLCSTFYALLEFLNTLIINYNQNLISNKNLYLILYSIIIKFEYDL